MSVRFGGKLDSYQTLRHLEARMGIGLFVWNLDTGELQWSDGMYALYGLHAGCVTPTPALTLSMIHPEDRICSGWLRHEVGDGRLLDRDFRAVLRDGRVRHINQRAWVTQGEDNARLVAGVCIDVTSLFEARAQSDLIQQRFRALIDAACGIVWIATPGSKTIEAVNLISANMPGTERNWLVAVPAEDKARLLAAWAVAVELQQPFTSLHRLAQSDGSARWYRSHAIPLRDRGLSVIEWIGMTIDVHDLIAGTEQPRQITGAQIRGGRGILNWSVRDLANAAGITVAIVRRLEEFNGTLSGYDEALSVVLRSMEAAGIEFFVAPGGKPAVRPR